MTIHHLFDDNEKALDFLAKVAYSAFARMHSEHHFAEWREDAIQQAVFHALMMARIRTPTLLANAIRLRLLPFIATVVLPGGPPAGGSGYRRLEYQQVADIFRQAGCRVDYARLIMLRLSGLSHHGIALETGLNVDVVRAMLSRGRRVLENYIAAHT